MALRLTLTMVAALALSLAGSGCGDGRSEAQKKCDHFGQLWCNGVIDCFVASGDLPSSQADGQRKVCLDGLMEVCDSAVEVHANYDSCIQDLSPVDCAPLVSSYEENGTLMLPASCINAIGGT